MNLIVKITALAAVALTAALLAASPAAALTHQSVIVDLDSTFVFGPGELCSFPVTFHQGPGQVKVNAFLDADGVLVKANITNYGGPDRATVSANGHTLTTVQTFSDFIAFNPDGSVANVADAGINYVFTTPHNGAVLLVVGLLRLDSNFKPTFGAGPGFASGPDTASLCAALS